MPGVVGPFHSLSESDRRGLVALVGSGRSVRSAAGELGCHYVHALNFCHAHGVPVIHKAKRVDRRGSQALQLVELVQGGPGRPFVVTDTEGFEHRLGIVSSIMRLADRLPELSGLKRYELGDFVYVLRFEDAIAVLDHGLHLFHKENRRVVARDYAWKRIEKCRPGEELEVLLEGGDYARLGKVVEVLVAETPNPLFS